MRTRSPSRIALSRSGQKYHSRSWRALTLLALYLKASFSPMPWSMVKVEWSAATDVWSSVGVGCLMVLCDFDEQSLLSLWSPVHGYYFLFYRCVVNAWVIKNDLPIKRASHQTFLFEKGLWWCFLVRMVCFIPFQFLPWCYEGTRCLQSGNEESQYSLKHIGLAKAVNGTLVSDLFEIIAFLIIYIPHFSRCSTQGLLCSWLRKCS